MVNGAVRLGDKCDGDAGAHPPRGNDEASTNVFVNNKGSHRLGDHWPDHSDLPGHESTAGTASPNIFVNKKKKCRIGNIVNPPCGATMAEGSSNVFVNVHKTFSYIPVSTGTETISGETIYSNNSVGHTAQRTEEYKVDPGLPTNHEGEPVLDEVTPTLAATDCGIFGTSIIKSDMSKQVSTNFKLAHCKMVPQDQLGLTSVVIACNWMKLCVNILEPIYALHKFKINSGFRTLEYNRSIGSKDTSDHTSGCAADISMGSQSSNKEIFKFILKNNLSFSQLIFEGNWVHVAFNGRGPKGNAKIMYTYTGSNPVACASNIPTDLRP